MHSLLLLFVFVLTSGGALATESSEEIAMRNMDVDDGSPEFDPGAVRPHRPESSNSPVDSGSKQAGWSVADICSSVFGSGTGMAILGWILRLLYQVYQRRHEIADARDFLSLLWQLLLLSIHLRVRANPEPVAGLDDIQLRDLRGVDV